MRITETEMAAFEDELPPKRERAEDALLTAMCMADDLFEDPGEAFSWLVHKLWDEYKPSTIHPRRREISPRLRRLVAERDEWSCVTCGSTDELQIDHIIPVVKGGPNVLENLRLLCGPCNREKGAL